LGALVLGLTAAAARAAGPAQRYVVLKDGSIFQGDLVESVPNDHVTIKLATGETRRFAWSDIAEQKEPGTAREPAPAEAAAAAPAAAPKTPHAPHPHAGAWSLDLRVPMSYIATKPGPVFSMLGLQVGVGERPTKTTYLGGFVEENADWNVGTDALPRTRRIGGETRYTFHEGEAEVSTTGDEGPYYPVPRYDWLGLRGGAESVGAGGFKGGFAEAALGTDAWLSRSFQFGVVFAAGLSVEPRGTYGSPTTSVSSTGGPVTSTSPRLNPYFTIAFHFGFGR